MRGGGLKEAKNLVNGYFSARICNMLIRVENSWFQKPLNLFVQAHYVYETNLFLIYQYIVKLKIPLKTSLFYLYSELLLETLAYSVFSILECGAMIVKRHFSLRDLLVMLVLDVTRYMSVVIFVGKTLLQPLLLLFKNSE